MVSNGDNRKTMLYIDDAIQAAILAATEEKANGEIFNIGENHYSFNYILDTIEKVLEVSSVRLKIPTFFAKIIREQKIIKNISRISETISSDNCYSNEKAKRMLRFKPAYSLEKGLKKSAKWYKYNS